ncbi:caspase family protein [Calothrix sp. FACHB-1219]|uniref:caspase family protein n=1 Tax=unclassified Calothrix TaxID=2619626 RepID=UPI0016863A3C|nr:MULTISPECIES: caspase family protein [unclassified Calothrix]MBD2206244.1 caspase family protein [Calothrix sp. FACHB-168]MBD2219140.1 caspase family protein [Calothrix sp. FACHB-1219]
MTLNLYAFLVGIDEYLLPVSPLQACVNDVTAIKDYLQGRVDKGGYQIHLHTLLDKDATQQAVINGFRQPLYQSVTDEISTSNTESISEGV